MLYPNKAFGLLTLKTDSGKTFTLDLEGETYKLSFLSRDKGEIPLASGEVEALPYLFLSLGVSRALVTSGDEFEDETCTVVEWPNGDSAGFPKGADCLDTFELD